MARRGAHEAGRPFPSKPIFKARIIGRSPEIVWTQPLVKRSHLYSYHAQHARMTEFAGYIMPLWFHGIREEHLAVRNAAGLFDVSHMGRFEIRGSDAPRFLDHVLPSSLTRLTDGRSLYSVLCNEKGGIVDDVIVSRFNPERYGMVVNAANIDKDLNWLVKHASGFNVNVENVTSNVGFFAFQGPKAQRTLQGLTGIPLDTIPRFGHREAEFEGVRVVFSRTGYTGEDGFEIFVPACPVDNPMKAERVWSRILSAGEAEGVLPCGLGARDTLRLEAGMCLYGQDIGEDTSPLEAGLGWVVSLDKGDFVGRDALLRQRDAVSRVRAGLLMKGKGIPRPGCEVMRSGEALGRVTSGTFSPLLKRGIAMAYIPKAHYAVQGEVEILIRGDACSAAIVGFPFYDAEVYGWKRRKA